MGGRELDADGCVNDLAEGGVCDKPVQDSLQPNADPLMVKGGSRCHVEIPRDRFVAIAIVRELLDVLPGDL
jgi:hypothetical protein